MRINKTIFLLIFLFTLTFVLNGQKQVNSPYSRFNLGAMEPTGPFRSIGMGGIGVSLRDNSSIFFVNPASYSSLDTNSFIFDFGIDYSYNTISDSSASYSSDDMNFDHLIIGFPITKGWGFATGVFPVSSGYYRLTDEVLESDADYNPAVGTYRTNHMGEGSFNKFFMGTGVKLNKNFSAGVNMTLLFGQIRRTNQFVFDDLLNVFHNSSSENLQLGGINFDYGIQYTTSLKNKYFINAGISFTTKKYYNTDYDHYIYKYTAYGIRDTISFTTEKGSSLIPGTIRAGVAIGQINKFTAGLDFVATQWSNSTIPGSAGYLADTKTLLFGIEYTPDKFSNFSFLKRVDYRLGGHAGNNYLMFDGEHVNEIGASFGLGIPMTKTKSKTNLFFDYTRKYGSSGGNLPSENYYTLGISLNLYDFWFIKRKYD